MLLNPYTFAVAGGGGSDPYWSNVSLLLHCDGSNGSTTFVDDSSNALTVTAHGAAALDTSGPMFGTASAFVDDNTHGGGADYVSAPITTGGPLDLQSGDWTVEGWLKSGRNGANQILLSMAHPFTGEGIFMRATCGSFAAMSAEIDGPLGSAVLGASVGPALNTWTHFALVSNGGFADLFVNGFGSGSPAAMPAMSSAWSGAFQLGAYPGSGGFTGNLDEVRITKGVARYTANFTPPAAPFAP